MGKASRAKRAGRLEIKEKIARRSVAGLGLRAASCPEAASTGEHLEVLVGGKAWSAHQIAMNIMAADEPEAFENLEVYVFKTHGTTLLNLEFNLSHEDGVELTACVFWQAYAQAAFKCLDWLIGRGIERKSKPCSSFISMFLTQLDLLATDAMADRMRPVARRILLALEERGEFKEALEAFATRSGRSGDLSRLIRAELLAAKESQEMRDGLPMPTHRVDSRGAMRI